MYADTFRPMFPSIRHHPRISTSIGVAMDNSYQVMRHMADTPVRQTALKTSQKICSDTRRVARGDMATHAFRCAIGTTLTPPLASIRSRACTDVHLSPLIGLSERVYAGVAVTVCVATNALVRCRAPTAMRARAALHPLMRAVQPTGHTMGFHVCRHSLRQPRAHTLGEIQQPTYASVNATACSPMRCVTSHWSAS